MTKFGLHTFACALLALTFAAVSDATNKYPIVLVHGLGGWGPGEFLGIPYWGTLQGDFPAKLRGEGYEVYTVGVGKVSSNWDRACELYARIKGGTVDYGANHARIHGHARFGRTFKGVFPQWGTVVNGQLQKAHLIGHSMGGTTIRMLTQMLNKGVQDALTPEDPASHPLFAGGKDWVHSVSTVSTPNRGSTLADMLADRIDLIETTVAVLSGVAGLLGDTTAAIYDPMLDQWGVGPKQPGEKLDVYLKRVLSSKLFAPGYLDNAGFSLATKGTKAENSWVKTLPNVYYYAFVSDATFSTRDLLFRRIALPNAFVINPLVSPLATLMGSRLTSKLGFSDEWLPNDGFVNVASQDSDGVSKMINFSGRSERGAWVRFRTLRMDHLGMMGANPLIPVYSLYKAHAALLLDLPGHEALTKTTRGLRGAADEDVADAGVHEPPLSVVQQVLAAQDPLA